MEQMKEVHEEAQATLKKAQDDMKVYADRRRSESRRQSHALHTEPQHS